jgi:hypothetical protein
MQIRACAVLFLLGLCRSAGAQKLSNVRAVVDSTNATVNILYDLEGSMDGQLFRVELYASLDKFSESLFWVTGQVGDSITPGVDKQIVWNAQKELLNFKGEVFFKAKAVLTFSPFLIKAPAPAVAYKRGKPVAISWEGGVTNDSVVLDLYRNGQKAATLARIPNRGEYRWAVPARTKPGRNYQVKISSGTKLDNSRMSNGFSIRRRIPLVIKTVPIAIGVGVFVVLKYLFKELPEPVKPSRDK